MTAGAEVVCSDVVRRVDIEEKCVAGLIACDLKDVGDAVTVDGNVGESESQSLTGNGCVGGEVKDDADDSTYVFVNGGVEVSADDPDDTGGVDVNALVPKSDSADEVDQLEKKEVGTENGGIPVDVNDFVPKSDSTDEVDLLEKEEVGIENGGIPVDVNDFVPKSDSADKVDRLEKEEVGMENEGIPVDSSVSETKGIVHESITVSDSNVKAVKDDVNLENGSTVDPPMVIGTNGIAQDVNGHPEKISGEKEAVVKSSEKVDDANEIQIVETKMDDVSSGLTFDPESTLNTIDCSHVTITESDSTIHQSDMPDVVSTTNESFSIPYTVSNTDSEVRANEEPEPISNLVDKEEFQVTVDGCGKPSEDLECQVTTDGSESSGSSTKGQVTLDESSKPSGDLSSQVTADEPVSFGSPIEERECSVSVELESNGNHIEELDGKSEEHQELLVITSEINVKAEASYDCGGMKAEHQSLSVSVPCQSENGEAEGIDVGLSTESAVNPDSGPVLSEDTVALANGEAESFDGVFETRETQISETEADKSVLLMRDVEKEKSEEKLEKQMDGSSETLLKVSGFVEIEANSEEMKGQFKREDEIQESQIVVVDDVDVLNLEDNTTVPFNAVEAPLETGTIQDDLNLEDNITVSSNATEAPLETETIQDDLNLEDSTTVSSNAAEAPLETETIQDDLNLEDNTPVSSNAAEAPLETETIQDDLNLEDKTTKSANEVEVPLETETNTEPVIHVNTTSQDEIRNSIDKPQECFRLEGNCENVETGDLVTSEGNNNELLVVKNNVSLSNPDELILVEQKAEVMSHLCAENRSAEDMDCGTRIENGDDDEKETEVKDVPAEYVPHENIDAKGMDCGSGVEIVDVSDIEAKGIEVKDAPVEIVPDLVIATSAEGMDSGTGVENAEFSGNEEKKFEAKDVPFEGHSTLSFSDTIVNGGAVIEFGSIGQHETTHNIHNEKAEYIESDEVPTSYVEGSVIESVDVQNEVAEILPYNFLIKIPRYEDENFRDQIRSAQVLVEERTRLRDAIRMEIGGKRAKLKAHNEAYNAAKAEEIAARRLVRLKRQEIDSVQVVINRWKNAMSVEDIDGRILNSEHMIQHETLNLKDEKQLIREIKQLKTLRDQLASNMGSPDEIRQAIDQKDVNEERMKTLRKELDSLKDKAAKAEVAVKTVGKTYDEESRGERELQAQFRAADDVRQQAYAHLNSLRKLSYEKNKNFRQFKEDLMAARDFASRGNKDELHRLCANQVETFMEQWNNNDEFRKDYVNRVNMNTSRRQRALDGGPLVPDDVAARGNVDEKADNGPVSIPREKKSVSIGLPVEEGKIVSSTENKHPDNNGNNRSTENVSGQKNQRLKTKGVAEPMALGSDDMAAVSELAEDNKKAEEDTLTKEEIELAKKAEESRKEEIAAKLKEQRRLEEKAKAIEALERKRRNAEKAQLRAELRARKEAEQKEKEREKRLRKREKKKTGGGDGSTNGEEAVASSESANDTTKDPEIVPKEKSKKKTLPAAHFYSKQQQQLKAKPIPPPLVNRNKKRWQQWGKYGLAVVGIFVLFLLGNTSYLRLKFNALI